MWHQIGRWPYSSETRHLSQLMTICQRLTSSSSHCDLYLSLYINLRQGALFSKKNKAHVGILNLGRLNYFIDIKNKTQKHWFQDSSFKNRNAQIAQITQIAKIAKIAQIAQTAKTILKLFKLLKKLKLSDCHYFDVMNSLLNAFRVKWNIRMVKFCKTIKCWWC